MSVHSISFFLSGLESLSYNCLLINGIPNVTCAVSDGVSVAGGSQLAVADSRGDVSSSDFLP